MPHLGMLPTGDLLPHQNAPLAPPWRPAPTRPDARRGGVGITRWGSFWGHGSGDVFIGFSTANRTPVAASSDLLPMRRLAEPRIDRLFEAMAEATGSAVLDALISAGTTTGRAGHMRQGLREALEQP